MPTDMNATLLRARAERRLNLGFLAAMLGLIGLGFFLYQGLHDMNDVSNSRAHVRQAAYAVKQLSNLLIDAETAQRGYLLTGRESYLAPYEKAKVSIPRVTVELESLFANQPEQLERLQRAGLISDEKMAELEKTIKLKRDHNDAEALKIVLSGRGQGYMDELRELAHDMDQEQKLQIAVHNERMSTILSSSTNGVFFGSGIAILIVAFCLYFVSRNQEQRLLSELTLLRSNEILEKQRLDLEKAQTDLIESRDQAEAATMAKSRFLANMSHELRTPLNGILGMTSLLIDGAKLTPQQEQYASAIKISGQSLLRLVSDILDFSKIEAGRLEFENVDFDIISTMQDVVKSFAFVANQKNLNVSFSALSDPPPYVKGDPGRVRQIIVNLIDNAIKFTPRGSVRVTVENLGTTGTESYLRFKVHDSGIGMQAATMESLFSEFTQADASTTRRYGGTGLGLSICKRLCEQMNGEIGVESMEGHGSTFWFTIRLQVGEKLEQPDLDDPLNWAIPTINRPWRTLIAEDNQFNQIIIVKMLEKLGIRADIAGNGKEAIDALQSRPYDLVLMDCQMPEMDGFEATHFIRTSGLIQHHAIPIIAMTANAMKGDRETCLNAGMSDYVSKPLEIKEVRELMIKWLPVSDAA